MIYHLRLSPSTCQMLVLTFPVKRKGDVLASIRRDKLERYWFTLECFAQLLYQFYHSGFSPWVCQVRHFLSKNGGEDVLVSIRNDELDTILVYPSSCMLCMIPLSGSLGRVHLYFQWAFHY